MVSRRSRRGAPLSRLLLGLALSAPLGIGCSAEFGGRCVDDSECGEARICLQGYCLPEDSPDRFADAGDSSDGGPRSDAEFIVRGCDVPGPSPAYDERHRPCADEHTAALWRFDDDFTAQVAPGAPPVEFDGEPDVEQVKISPEDGIFGGAATFSGGGDPGMTATDPIRAIAPLTIELWARLAGQDGNSRTLVGNLDLDRDLEIAGGFELFVDQSDADPAAYQLGLAFAERRTRQGYETSATFPADRWTHLAAVIEEDGTVKLYVDGVEETFAAIPATGRGRDLRFGRRTEGGDLRPYPGALDEVRLSTIARDADSLRRAAEGATRPE